MVNILENPIALPKTNMDTQNDGPGLEKVTLLNNCNSWYLC